MASSDVASTEPNVLSFSKLAGCLLGQSLGDALAILLRGCSASAASDCVDGIISKWLAGQRLDELPAYLLITEGSQLSWEIVLLYVQQQSFSPPAFAERIKDRFNRRWVHERYLETHLAVKQLRTGQTWQDAGIESFGCGGLQRAPSIGAIFWNASDQRRAASRQQCQITHKGKVVCAASMLISELVASLLRSECGPGCQAVPIAIPEDDPGLGDLLAGLVELLTKQPDEALSLIAPPGDRNGDGIADHVGQCLLWALYCTLSCDWNFVTAVTLALRCGGELVAPVSLVAALCGAAQGIEAIPNHLLEKLSDRGVYGKSAFLDRCHGCYKSVARASNVRH